MKVNAIIPNLPIVESPAERDFYTGFLELNPGFDYGGVAGYASPTTPAAQVHLMAGSTDQDAEFPVVSIQVSDVVAAYAEAQRRGYEIVYPLTQESFGPHRFVVKTPGGTAVLLIEHES